MSRLAKADKIAIGELNANLLGPTHTLSVKAKIVSSRTGASYGSMTVQHWTQRVQDKFRELIETMEEELEIVFFDDVESTPSAPKSFNEPAGLGEHLQGDDLAEQA